MCVCSILIRTTIVNLLKFKSDRPIREVISNTKVIALGIQAKIVIDVVSG